MILVAAFIVASLVHAGDVLARAGGGGSSSGGGGGGHSSGGSHYRSSSGSSSGGDISPLGVGVIFFVMGSFLAFMWYASDVSAKRAAQARKERLALLEAAAAKDPAWSPAALDARVREVFFAFQKAWSEFDADAMGTLLTKEYLKRMVLELTVLQNLGRKNAMDDLEVLKSEITGFVDEGDDAKDRFDATIRARAVDRIVDVRAQRTLHTDRSEFTEYWKFRREGGVWKLEGIGQSTEASWMVEPAIADFAAKNGFYYDPDFGWLMMPDKGALFGQYAFGKADINNHVIGWYRGKVVEFYTYVSHPGADQSVNWLVAQAILPIEHRDILVRKRQWLMPVPAGLREIETEFGDFNKKFQVCAHPDDSIATFELLTTNFMAKIHDLPFDLNVEVVGNVLYLYVARRDVSYAQMLEVLSWAFDEMKM